jgi:hypothetical protein
VFENRVLRGIFGRKRDDVTRGSRKLHYEGLHKLFSSTFIIRAMTSKRMRWVGHVARMRKINEFKVLLETLKARGHSEDVGIGGIILK